MKLLAALRSAITPAFQVKLTGRAGIRYREGKKVMMIDSEMLTGELDMVVYTNSILRWLPPHEEELITQEKKEAICANLAQSLKRLKIDWA